ncbi:MAG: pantoate--beta-alanine ligase [Bacteroidales bacterium]|jgi:pantoate--beta-alanine ligase|nr:pantoate--beta-alanine ligase [Bacteroidales bacterium]
MRIYSTVAGIRKRIRNGYKGELALVPTMGALHAGHISLVNTAVSNSARVIVSIFVNPTQFNDKNDLKNYPRTLEKDKEMLKKVLRKDDILFIPSVSEIYPVEDKRVFDFGDIGKVMEGAHRPGHFNGVAQVVSRLFEITEPDTAYFGQKDFQQVTIIKELARQQRYPVRICVNPIIREEDGLAMSSRNALLEPEIRAVAPVIYKTISRAVEMIKGKDIDEIREFVTTSINKVAGFSVEYFEVVDDTALRLLKSVSEISSGVRYFACIAVKAGKIRLIDNIEIPVV